MIFSALDWAHPDCFVNFSQRFHTNMNWDHLLFKSFLFFWRVTWDVCSTEKNKSNIDLVHNIFIVHRYPSVLTLYTTNLHFSTYTHKSRIGAYYFSMHYVHLRYTRIRKGRKMLGWFIPHRWIKDGVNIL